MKDTTVYCIRTEIKDKDQKNPLSVVRLNPTHNIIYNYSYVTLSHIKVSQKSLTVTSCDRCSFRLVDYTKTLSYLSRLHEIFHHLHDG